MPEPKLVERLRDLLARATPRPWRTGIWMGDEHRKHVVDMGVPDGVTTFTMLTERYGFGFPPSAIIHSDGDHCEIEANAELIVEGINALPQLLDRIERLEAALREARRVVEHDADACRAFAGPGEISTPEQVLATIDAALSASNEGE